MKYTTLILSFFIIFGSGCSKIIDIQETDLIAGDIALKTVSNCEQGVIGAYALVGVEMGILLNAVFSDEVRQGEFYNSGTAHQWQYAATDVVLRDNFTATTPNYRIIDRVNRVIAALPIADSLKAADNTALRNRVTGEAHFLRAYAHFEVFRYYCGKYDPDGWAMPYMEAPSLDYQARIKMAPFFEKLNADLVTAKALVPTALTDLNRANRAAVVALQARVALYSENWAAAEAFATEYIGLLPLSPIGSFAGIWTGANTNEVGFRLVRTTALNIRIGGLFRATSSNTSSGVKLGTVTWIPSEKIWNVFDQTNDVRFNAYLKSEPLLTADNGRNAKIINKYAGGAYTTATENLVDAKVFRTGEMYLIRAEARAEQTRFTGANSAESDLNELRAARINNYVPVTLASKDAAIAAIIQERFKELAFEGHRFWDLKRKNLPVERSGIDVTESAAILPAGNFRFLLPIPDPEIKANLLMEQNPGYAE